LFVPRVRGIDGEEFHSDPASQGLVDGTIDAGVAALTDDGLKSVPPVEQDGTV
jgi:hypothetical protein